MRLVGHYEIEPSREEFSGTPLHGKGKVMSSEAGLAKGTTVYFDPEAVVLAGGTAFVSVDDIIAYED